MVPKIGSFFTPLKLVEAFREYDEFFALSRRRYVPPNFAEMRHVLNIAQVSPRTPTRLTRIIKAFGVDKLVGRETQLQGFTRASKGLHQLFSLK